MAGALVDPVRRFVEDLAPVVEGLGGRVAGVDARRLREDVAVEATTLVCAFIDADERHTDDELRALVEACGPHLPTSLARATPAALRAAGLVSGKRATLDAPSTLFEVLLGADGREGTAHARTYYERAMDIAFAVAAVDLHPSREELETIERFRGRLLDGIADARPAPGATPAAATAGGPTAEDDEEVELPPERTIEDLLAELHALIGLDGVKREVQLLVDLAHVERLRRELDLPVVEQSRHLVFTGNPGTGKTTVARVLSQLYRTLGVVDKGHLVETDRSQLVAGFVGQTAIKVREVFDKADGGTLLVDEAYALVRGGGNDFGREAIDTIVKLVEDRRDALVVIVAGYPEEMAVFVEANPGLRSRFPKSIHFPDYTTDELLAIFTLMGEKHRYELSDAAREATVAWFDAVPRERGFGNGRLARNLFETAVSRQASRLAKATAPVTETVLVTLEPADLPAPGEAL
jgi:Cdc6-like AAA superfamily ATPase